MPIFIGIGGLLLRVLMMFIAMVPYRDFFQAQADAEVAWGGSAAALGTGTGSEFRRPLGIAIIGGSLVSQLLTLYTTPVVYSTRCSTGGINRGKSPAEAKPLPSGI